MDLQDWFHSLESDEAQWFHLTINKKVLSLWHLPWTYRVFNFPWHSLCRCSGSWSLGRKIYMSWYPCYCWRLCTCRKISQNGCRPFIAKRRSFTWWVFSCVLKLSRHVDFFNIETSSMLRSFPSFRSPNRRSTRAIYWVLSSRIVFSYR